MALLSGIWSLESAVLEERLLKSTCLKGEPSMRIGQTMIPEFEMEMANTRKVLERVPDDKLDWKIHEKSNTIGWVREE